MLRNEDCTVTVARYTQNLPEIVKQADIVVAAVLQNTLKPIGSKMVLLL